FLSCIVDIYRILRDSNLDLKSLNKEVQNDYNYLKKIVENKIRQFYKKIDNLNKSFDIKTYSILFSGKRKLLPGKLPKKGDLVFFFHNKKPCHSGIALDKGKIIHLWGLPLTKDSKKDNRVKINNIKIIQQVVKSTYKNKGEFEIFIKRIKKN
ncbi:hypothetical protein ACFL2K_04370, partial [Candidatus Margulisiibacteriota bacterium]